MGSPKKSPPTVASALALVPGFSTESFLTPDPANPLVGLRLLGEQALSYLAGPLEAFALFQMPGGMLPGPSLEAFVLGSAAAPARGGAAILLLTAILAVGLVLVILRLLGAERRLRELEEAEVRHATAKHSSAATAPAEESEGLSSSIRPSTSLTAAPTSAPSATTAGDAGPDEPTPNLEGHFAAALQTVFDALIVADAKGRVQALSPMAERLVGKTDEECRGRPLGELLPLRSETEAEASFDPTQELRSRPEPTRFDGLYLYSQAGGRMVYLEIAGAPVSDPRAGREGGPAGFVLTLRDVTDRQMIEAELAKAQKLETLGLLASGIAHDFNNLLTIMMGNFSLLQSETSLPAELQAPIEEAEKALARARGLADQLLTFSSGGAPRTRSIDLGNLIRESSSFVFRGAKSRCNLDLPRNLPPADVDPEQISQVFNNLLINARQATSDGGSVWVGAETIKIGLGKTKLRPGSYVKVTIRDDGEGIPAETLPKIFDPQFTTKKSGSGLGLETSYSIIKRHRGSIQVESDPSTGTTFTLLLRTARGPAERKPEEQPTESSSRGRVLVMDDEHSILALLSAALKRLGFEAVATTDGDAAVRACEDALESGNPLDLAILDLTIPGGKGGVEAAQELARMQPGLLLVASSGYSQNPAIVEFQDYGFHQVLVKPYRIPDLSKLLDNLLPPNLASQ